MIKIQQVAEGSLRRLNLESLDLCQLHWPERNVPFFENLNMNTMIKIMKNLN